MNTPSELYDDLLKAMALAPDYRSAYQVMENVFQECLAQAALQEGVHFSGPFALADYLLKAHQASPALRQTMGDARVRFRRQHSLTDEELAANFLHDFKALCQFVSLVFSTPVPTSLQAHFPAARTFRREPVTAECLRIIVGRWDDAYIYATPDAAHADDVKVFYGGATDQATYKEWDWSYMRDYLKAGTQLNLVRPREHDGVLYPELIILEPDYLVDISAIAACFENFGESPLLHLLGKLKPAASTSATVLGNMASQFLDESLHSSTEGHRTYAESARQFFLQHALSLLTTPLDDDFHAQARSQQQHIRRIIDTVLPQVLHTDGMQFCAADVIVEPSFFSEMLGIQGRMDFLHLGHKVLIEQKSGKGAFPQRDPDTPVCQQKHYVQLLLYMLLLRYNYRQQYEQGHRELHAFLLYSRYSNGLLGLGFAPQLVFQAVMVRNGIVAAEFSYTRGGLDVLLRLSADSLNRRHLTGPLWTKFQRPQMEALLAPIHAATPLERAYYLRQLRFIATEHLLAKTGTQTTGHSGFADKWHSTLADKLQAGSIICGLQMVSPAASQQGRVERLTLRYPDGAPSEASSFRVGDIVILYSYQPGSEPDARQTMVFRCTIERLQADGLTLNLRSAQADAHVFWHEGQRSWAIEPDMFESSYTALYRGMHAFLSAPKQRRDLLLLQRPPRYDERLTLAGDYGQFNELALRVKQAQELFLIIGPPGTGKTSFGLMTTLTEALRSGQQGVLLLAFTNRAVDEICSKLVAADIDFIRMGSRYSCAHAYHPYLFDTLVQACPSVESLRQHIGAMRVFVGTAAALSACGPLFQLKQFGLAVIDEASQLLEPHLMGLLSAIGPHQRQAIDKLVLIGDHKQLPAVVLQGEADARVDEPLQSDIQLTDCRQSLFERLLRRYRNDPHVVFMLTRQGRMHRDIARFPNEAFYQGLLCEADEQRQHASLPTAGQEQNGIDDVLLTRRVAFFNVAPLSQTATGGHQVNPAEAQAIAATVARIYQLQRHSFSPAHTVGVIVPYRRQIAEIRHAIDHYGIPALSDITIDTVERFQGSQRDNILYGFTVQRHYQLSFLTSSTFSEDGHPIDRRLNVVMTRARQHLLLFGCASLLHAVPLFSHLMQHARLAHSFFSVPLADYVEGRFSVPKSQVRETQ